MGKNVRIENTLLVALICVLFLAGIFFQGTKNELQKKYAAEKKDYTLYAPVGDIPIAGNAAYIFNITENKPVYVKHESWKLPLASLAKIMTTLVAKEALPSDTIITIPKSAISQSGDTGLLVGEKWALDDLLKLMLVSSSNDAARSIAEAVELRLSPHPDLVSVSSFVKKMNETAQKLSLTDMSFINDTGLDVTKEDTGAYGSAKDVALLFSYAYQKYPDIFTPTTLPDILLASKDGKVHKVVNTDIITNLIPHLVASKTGFTAIAGGNLAIIFKVEDETMIAVVLGSSQKDRFSDMQKMVQAAYTWQLRKASL